MSSVHDPTLVDSSGSYMPQAASTPPRPVVCVQGLGFVGAPTAIAVAEASAPDGSPRFDVIGVELPTAEGDAKVRALNEGRLPIATTDVTLGDALRRAHARGNFAATVDEGVFERAAVTVVSVPLDVQHDGGVPSVAYEPFRHAIRTLGRRMQPGSLVVVQTTVPPGTTQHVVVPELARALGERGLPAEALHVAHSYERVMPGREYLESMVSFWRVYAGATPAAADACERFLSSVIDVDAYPLTRLESTTASETAKVLENAYRATTIALMEEWGRFAEAVGVDLFGVIDAIRMRPTHSNIRQPGFGVGGYCITKDPLLAPVGARDLYGLHELEFPFSRLAVAVNAAMPLSTVHKLDRLLGGLSGRTILLLGVSYRPDVADTRYSPSETFVRAVRERGADVICHDPLVSHWPELAIDVATEIPSPEGIDAVVLAVRHAEYAALDLAGWLGSARPLVVDANDVLSGDQRTLLRRVGCRVVSVGRGEHG